MLLFSSHPFFFLFVFLCFPLLVFPIFSLPHFSPCHPTFHPYPSTLISSSSTSFLLIFHVFPLHYTLSSTLPSPLKFVSVLPLVTSSSLCPPQHGSRCVEQSWRGVAGSGKHRRRHWVFSHRLGAGSQQPHPALHHHSQSAMRKTQHRACLHATSQTHTHTHRPVKRCTAKPSHTHKLRVYIEMQRVQINRLPSVYPCFPQCLSCGHVYVSVRVSFPRCVLSPSSDSVQIIILRSLKVVFTCCLVQIHTYTLSSFNINGLDFL